MDKEKMSIMAFTLHNHPILILILTPLLILLVRSLYRLSPFHPLSHIPGPILPRLTSLWLNYHAYIGDECTMVHALHQKYGRVVLTSPSSVDISDGAALHDIYVEKGGFLKPTFYSNFDIDGHATIFSEVLPKSRGPRAKAVMPIFSTGSLKAGKERIEDAVEGFVARFGREIEKAKKSQDGRIDVLAISRSLAIDVVTGYLFEKRYGGCEEDQNQPTSTDKQDGSKATIQSEPALTASAMVDSFVAVGRLWYLPPWAFQQVDRLITSIWPDKAADQSMNLVDSFVTSVVTSTQDNLKSSSSETTSSYPSYPTRLLQAGFTPSEVHAQCKDLIFAGTDSTAMNLATILFLLVQYPDVYTRLRHELTSTNLDDNNNSELQSLPYLRAVIREGQRLAMANPSRLPRLVPPGGWTFNSDKNNQFHLLHGTVVSCAPYELHFDADVFPEPRAFRPERWNEPTESMNRDYIPFGLGSRQCIARNLAVAELFFAVNRIVKEDLLSGMECVGEKIEIVEWFNSHVVGGKVELKVR